MSVSRNSIVLTRLSLVLCDAENLQWANDIHRIKSIVEAEQDLTRLAGGQRIKEKSLRRTLTLTSGTVSPFSSMIALILPVLL